MKKWGLAAIVIGVIMLIAGVYMLFHYSIEWSDGTIYTVKSRIGEVIAFAGFGLVALGFKLRDW